MQSINTTKNKNFPYKLSYREKTANDYELAKEAAEYYASFCDESKEDRYHENFDIHRGAWKAIENLSPGFNMIIDGERVEVNGGPLRHIPVQNQVSQAIVGEAIMTPLIPIIRDISSNAVNHRERVMANRVKQFFVDQFVTPPLNAFRIEFFKTNPNASPEELQEAETNAQKETINSLPEEIRDSLDAHKMPDELLAQKILERIILDQNVKEKIDMGADYAVVVGEEYYHTRILNGQPSLKLINGKNLEWGGSEGIIWTHEGEFAKYDEYLSFQEVVSDFGAQIKWKDINDIAGLFSAIPNTAAGLYEPTETDMEITDLIHDNPQFNDPTSPLYINPTTTDGTQKMMSLYRMLGHMRDKNYAIKHTYVCWRWTRKAKAVTRLRDNKEVEEIEDEHYVKNPALGDIKVKWILLEQVWETDIINDEYYLNIGPVKYQYQNIGDYRKPWLPIIGLKYNTFHNNAKNASFIDLGKPAQFKLNLVHKKLEEYEATDYGVLLGILPSLKPDNQSWTQFFTSAFQKKVFLMNKKFEGYNVNDKSPFEKIDLSRQIDIESTIRKAEYYENQIIKQMLYNPVKFGQIGQYSTNQNAALSMQGADRQMVSFMNKRRLLKQKLLTQLLNLGIIAFRDNDYLKELLFDDLQKAYLDLNVEPFAASSLGLYIVDDFEDTENVKQMKSYGLTFMQNGGSPKDISAIISAKSMQEINEVLDKAEKRMQENLRNQQAHEAEIAQMNAKAQENALKMKMEFDFNMNERNNQTKLKMADINAEINRRGSDVDQNAMNDSLQKTILEIASNERIANKKLEVEKLKIGRQ